MQTTLTAKRGATGGAVHWEWRRNNQRLRTQMGTGSAAFCQPHGTRLPVPTHCSELNQASMCDNRKDEEKTPWKNSQDGWDKRPFFPQDLAGRGNGTVLYLLGLFFVAPHAALQAAEPCSGSVRKAAANSSSALQLSIFLIFVQIKPYFVSKLLRVLHTSKVREIILNKRLCW